MFAESFLNFGYAGLLIVALFGFSLRVFYRRSLIYNEIEQQYAVNTFIFFGFLCSEWSTINDWRIYDRRH